MNNIFLYEDGRYIDVTDKEIVLWSAGYNSRERITKCQLTISSVVDKDVSKQGLSIVLSGREYIIQAPESLKGRDINKYFIVIGSVDYRESIRTDISKLLGDEVCVCDEIEKMIIGYDSIDKIIYDPRLFYQIAKSNISLELQNYIAKSKKILDEFCPNNITYIPLYGGSRLCFRTLGLNNDYVIHLPVKIFREEYSQSTSSFLKNSYKAFTALEWDNTPVVYIDEEGIVVEKYCSIINWNKEYVRKTVELIRQLHFSGREVSICHSFKDRLESKEKFIHDKKIPFIDEFIDKLHNVIYKELNNYCPCICHGDVSSANIGILDGSIVLYDWEWVGMSDPAFDVVKFYYVIGYKFFDFDNYLKLYYLRDASEQEKYHARVICLGLRIRDYFNSIITEMKNRDAMYETLILDEIKDILDE